MLALLVQATVFKTVGSCGNHVIGGFDSHALPPFIWLTQYQEQTPIRSRQINRTARVDWILYVRAAAGQTLQDCQHGNFHSRRLSIGLFLHNVCGSLHVLDAILKHDRYASDQP